jgi:alkanesulfonate monooxygenase
MGSPLSLPGLSVFTTCPSSLAERGDEYICRIAEAAQWSDETGCEGILIYTDNSVPDPWLVAQALITRTRTLAPLVAVQPVYMHPYTVAKLVATLGMLYGRRLHLNMVAGGFKNDLLALHDPTPHDRRYARLEEFTHIVMELLRANQPVTFAGEFYAVTGLRLSPALPRELLPGLMLSASSEAGLATAKRIGAVAVQYPGPAAIYQDGMPGGVSQGGIRVGVIARESDDEAWAVAHSRFPEDRKGQLTRQLATQVSDSAWHKQLSELGQDQEGKGPYWLVPFSNYKTNCPYLVGSYDRVAEEIARYLKPGYRSFILDVPPSREELEHTGEAFARAWRSFAP